MPFDQQAVRGSMKVRMECAPAFDYARAEHTTTIGSDPNRSSDLQNTVMFTSAAVKLDLRYVTDTTMTDVSEPSLSYGELDLRKKGHKGMSVYSEFELAEGQVVTFVLRIPPDDAMSTKDIGGPTEERAKQLGVSITKLAASMAKLRPEDDPVLNASDVIT